MPAVESVALSLGALYLLTALLFSLRTFDISSATRIVVVGAAAISGTTAIAGAVLRRATETNWWVVVAVAGCVAFPLVMVLAEAR